LPETAGASLLNENLLVLRALADDSLSLRRYLIPVLELLSGQSLPAVWRL
jgi:urease accessory protein